MPRQSIKRSADATTPDVLSAEEQRDYDHAKEIIRRNLRSFLEVGLALATVHERRLYRQQYGSFETFLQEEFGVQRAHGYRLIEAARVVSLMQAEMSPLETLPVHESQARELAAAPPVARPAVWREAQREAGTEQPHAEQVRAVVLRQPVPKPQGRQGRPPQRMPQEPATYTDGEGITHEPAPPVTTPQDVQDVLSAIETLASYKGIAPINLIRATIFTSPTGRADLESARWLLEAVS